MKTVKIFVGFEVARVFKDDVDVETLAYEYVRQQDMYIFDKRVDLDGTMVWYCSK